MSRADDRDQERYLQQCIDTMWGNYALRDMLTAGFERLTGSARRQTVHFPKPTPLLVKAPSDPVVSTLEVREFTITITLPDDRRAVREPTLDEIKALRGKLDEWHNGLLDELLGGPINNGVARPPSTPDPWANTIADPNYNATLTLQDMQNAWNTLVQSDPSGMSGAGFAINAMDPYACSLLACKSVSVPMPEVPEVLEQPRNLCYVCGQERDPDVEPVTLELPPGAPNPSGGILPYALSVEACSRECATAYAIKLEPVRSQPALGRFFEQRHQERHATLGDDVTDSIEGRPWNPWTDADWADTDDGDEIVVTTQEYGVWTIDCDPSDDAA